MTPGERQEQWLVTAWDANKNIVDSSVSPRGTTQSCGQNPYESGPWGFRVKSTCQAPIKYIRIDYVGMILFSVLDFPRHPESYCCRSRIAFLFMRAHALCGLEVKPLRR